jgi:hypothetical protein
MSNSVNYKFLSFGPALMVREGDPIITPEVQALIDAQVAGLKNKNNELLGQNKALKDSVLEVTEKLKNYDGIDAPKAKQVLAMLESDEDLRLFQSGQKDAVIQKHTERMRADYESKLSEKDKAIQAEALSKEAYKGKVLEAQILQAAAGLLHKSAIDDALLHGKTIFSLDAKGNAVKLDAEGKPELGKDAKTAFSPKEWLESMREQNPHCFPQSSSGGGSPGSSGSGAAGGKVIKRSDFDRLEAKAKTSYIRAGGTVVD